ncbi:AraC family transcriptional regulator [Algoriphagus machipongonensis]|uniref:Transcriptional regulator, AraC family n=1 Tax=Algoriphagus machipongonensis TaxID=388413 RepID=A3HVZ7_9BACT|nr:AraC family transcriptional regulator [Algoriphagus machipongonensis]EAZ82319.1 putative transcriptional regulator, AraC family [Algoriphagus machipongonensis]
MSKVISFQIPKAGTTFIQYQEDRGMHFYNNLHQHPQCQLTVIIEGRGQLLVGDYVGRFEPGDLFLLGENIPHVFRSDAEYFDEENKLSSSGNTLFFDFKAIEKSLGEVDEFRELIHLNEQINGCFKIEGTAKKSILELFQNFSSCSGLEKLQKAIHMLSLIKVGSKEIIALNLIPVTRSLSERDGKRMDQVMRYILENSAKPISLDEIAEQAYMSKEAFCRFFKLRTRRTFTQYLQQLRITEAKKLLLETDLGISQISYQVGFQTLSHFNKTFKSMTNQTPKSWRKLN